MTFPRLQKHLSKTSKEHTKEDTFHHFLSYTILAVRNPFSERLIMLIQSARPISIVILYYQFYIMQYALPYLHNAYIATENTLKRRNIIIFIFSYRIFWFLTICRKHLNIFHFWCWWISNNPFQPSQIRKSQSIAI